MTPLHDLLPWYVNRTLEPAERARFEAHLPECPACRDELPIVERMRVRLEQEGEALLADHPSPVELVAALAAEPDAAELAPDKVKLVRRHLALCVTCGEEARWVLRASPAGAAAPVAGSMQPARGDAGTHAPGRRTPSPAWRAVPAWAWPAAALLIVAVGLPLAGRFRPAATRAAIIRPARVEPTRRAAEGPTAVVVPVEGEAIHLMFPVDVAPGEFPLRLEIADESGRIVHRIDAVAFDDLFDGLLLQLALPRDEVPDGTYVARLLPAAGSAIEYPFQLRGSTGAQ